MGIDLPTLLLTALALSADCFAVAVGAGIAARKPLPAKVLRLALAFGFFQTLMAMLGWLAGRAVVGFIASYDHWVAFLLLAFIGGKMVRESRSEEEREKGTDITRGLPLLVASIATSIDSLAVGLGLALLATGIALVSSTIGVVAFAVTAAGFWLGRRAGELIGRRAELVGGIILIAIGLRILLTHIL